MAYATVTELKSYAGITGTTDDALLAALINRAQGIIERFTGRKFEATADETRRIEVGVDTDGKLLYLPEDLAQITSVVNDADGTPVTMVVDTDYYYQPANPPHRLLRIFGNTAYSWAYTHDPTGGVIITGRWAYSVTPPPDIVHATIRLATFLYRQKDASTFDTTAIPDAGVIMVPQGMPKDVALILDAYKVPRL